MADNSGPLVRLVERGWLPAAGVTVSLALGVFVLLLGVAEGGVGMLMYLLFGVVPFVAGALGLARVLWTEPDEPERAPMEELKRRYAAGDLEDETLERKVEALLQAETDRVPEDRERERSRR